jgi:rhodanese-related sulfurtransferase
MKIFFKKYLIKYEDITNEITIDVRTKEQYLEDKILKYNIPIINKKEHDFLKRHLFWAEVIIIFAMLRNIKEIKKELLEKSNNKNSKVVIGCSKGRLRSPTMWVYAKLIGIDAKVLEDGVYSVVRG